MIHLGANIFLFFVILILGWILFFAWAVGIIFRTVWRGIQSAAGVSKTRWDFNAGSKKCPAFRCGAPNPLEANFCRRCGSSLKISAGAAARQSDRRWVSSTVSS